MNNSKTTVFGRAYSLTPGQFKRAIRVKANEGRALKCQESISDPEIIHQGYGMIRFKMYPSAKSCVYLRYQVGQALQAYLRKMTFLGDDYYLSDFGIEPGLDSKDYSVWTVNVLLSADPQQKNLCWGKDVPYIGISPV
ncbi:MAG: hypothetical protein JAY72_17835 [Candidatus Thiodiazotropha endolucinida]|nr:hypothetical protein [Candidatus Thiodiazotropha taylori]MCW4323546.1 hypothetical protein [Candidatus Thiodiazotropha taylori]